MSRKDNRVSFINEVVLEWASGKRDARISDLSAGGCYVDTIATLPEGTGVEFELRSKDGRSMKFQGEVAYTISGMGFGIKFTNMTSERSAFLAGILPSA